MRLHDSDSTPIVLPTINHTPDVPKPASLKPGQRVEWDWDVEHADRAREREADAAIHHAQPFEVDRRVLRDIVQEKMGEDVGRICFMGSGTFNKAYLITLASGRELVARIARRFMPKLKTSSEVATMHYLRTHTSIPVPDVYHYDANPYNRLGGEFILMSKAKGIPLSRVYHAMSHKQLLRLMENAANLLIPLFGQRFPALGSLYLGSAPGSSNSSLVAPPTPGPFTPTTPTASFLLTPTVGSSYMATPTAATPRPGTVVTPRALAHLLAPSAPQDVHVGPIVSWPFFGSGRGDLQHPEEMDRGPWKTTYEYLLACAHREIRGVIRENEGKAAPHRLHLDPDEIQSSRHHHLRAVPGDQSDESTEWELEESECEWDGPGDIMYSDYRRMQRSTFLVAHMKQREQAVGEEFERWISVMERLGVGTPAADAGGGSGQDALPEEFALDCHDLNLENVFVDENDHSTITCIIDWESTTTRPLWQSAHVPAFAQSSPFTAKLFRAAVSHLAENSADLRTATLAQEWLDNEAHGARLRAAHRFVEWDGWEEGLVETILGSEETQEETWFRDWEDDAVEGEDEHARVHADALVEDGSLPESVSAWHGIPWVARDADESGMATGAGSASPPDSLSDSRSSPPTSDDTADSAGAKGGVAATLAVPSLGARGNKPRANSLALRRPDERERERLLDATGDMCGGRGGELGRRLEAWLYSVHGDAAEEEGVRAL